MELLTKEQILLYAIFGNQRGTFIVNRYYTGTRKLTDILTKLVLNEIKQENL